MKDRIGRVATWQEMERDLNWELKELGFEKDASLGIWKIEEEKKEREGGGGVLTDAAIIFQ